MNVLYIDCFSGISGDMMIGALLDIGGDLCLLESELKKLCLQDEYKLSLKKVMKNGISASKFDVILMDNHLQKHNQMEIQGSDHSHLHVHSHQHQRGYKEIVELITSSSLSEKVKEISLSIFLKIGQAEAKIHGISIDQVHFHEVGAVDSIIDIVGTAILLEQLNAEKISSSPVPVGSGKVRIDHGIYPIPAPATLEILKGIPIMTSDIQAELATPTGAAIIAGLATSFGSLPEMTIAEIGYGAGTKTFHQHPNIIRAILGKV